MSFLYGEIFKLRAALFCFQLNCRPVKFITRSALLLLLGSGRSSVCQTTAPLFSFWSVDSTWWIFLGSSLRLMISGSCEKLEPSDSSDDVLMLSVNEPHTDGWGPVSQRVELVLCSTILLKLVSGSFYMNKQRFKVKENRKTQSTTVTQIWV